MRAISICTLLGLLCGAGATAAAADIGLLGLFPDKAMLSFDGGPPKVYAVGSTLADGSKLVAAGNGSATIEQGGKRYTIALGEAASRGSAGAGKSAVTLSPDARGHYTVQGRINGVPAAMMVDTGASLISLPASDAVRMGIDYRRGRVVQTSTANGMSRAYLVRLDTVRIGDMELSQFDALVHEGGLTVILLGNSFLNRFDMRRDGEQMTLTRRY